MPMCRGPRSYWTNWGGAFEQRQSATKRLQIVVPVSLLLVFVLLFTMFGNIKDGLLVFTGVPCALTGGIVALWLRGIPLSISAGVGFIALSGVAVLTGLVMIAAIRSLREDGLPLDRAIHEAKSDAASDRSGARLEIRRLITVSAVAAMKPAQVGNRTNRCQCPRAPESPAPSARRRSRRSRRRHGARPDCRRRPACRPSRRATC